MSLARARLVHAAAAVSILVSVASTASAQRRDRHVVDGGRVALIAPSPTPVVVVAPRSGFYGSPYAYQYGYAPYGYFPNAAIVQNIPVVMLQDGRVFANFGYGYEQVVRTCTPGGIAPIVRGYQPVTTGSTIVQPTAVQPIVTQPAPAQATASEQMLARALSPAAVVTAVPGPLAVQLVTPSCWSSYAGSVFVFRR